MFTLTNWLTNQPTNQISHHRGLVPWVSFGCSSQPSPALSLSKTETEALKCRLLIVYIQTLVFFCFILGFMLDVVFSFLWVRFCFSFCLCSFFFFCPHSCPIRAVPFIPEGFHFSLAVSPRLPVCRSFRLSSLLCLGGTKGKIKEEEEEEHRYESPSCTEGPGLFFLELELLRTEALLFKKCLQWCVF